MQKLLDTFKKLENFKYHWRYSDCYTLANTIRKINNLETLPDLSWFYDSVSENQMSNDYSLLLINLILTKHTSNVYFHQDFDLVVMQVGGNFCLGTLIEDYVIYLASCSPTYKALSKLNKFVMSINRYSLAPYG